MLLVITDLDGALLDFDTCSFEPALPALERLRREGTALVFCTSKTRAETELWRERTGNTEPFVVENGGAVFFPGPDGLERIELGRPYRELIAPLDEAAAETGCPVRGFHHMSLDEIARECGLDLQMAALARNREYDEPFIVEDEARAPALIAAIGARGLLHTRGGRFHHITGDNDKARAVELIVARFRALHPDLVTAGLGDGLNDAPFLNRVDYPFLIRGRLLDRLQSAVPRGVPTSLPGPAGWNEAILSLPPFNTMKSCRTF